MAKLVSGADFGCILHHFSGWNSLWRSWGQVRPGNAEKPRNFNLHLSFQPDFSQVSSPDTCRATSLVPAPALVGVRSTCGPVSFARHRLARRGRWGHPLPRGPLKGPRDPLKGPRGPLKNHRGPLKGPRGPFKGTEFPNKSSPPRPPQTLFEVEPEASPGSL